MTNPSGALAALLVDARGADPAHRIDWRDPIAAHGAAASAVSIPERGLPSPVTKS